MLILAKMIKNKEYWKASLKREKDSITKYHKTTNKKFRRKYLEENTGVLLKLWAYWNSETFKTSLSHEDQALYKKRKAFGEFRRKETWTERIGTIIEGYLFIKYSWTKNIILRINYISKAKVIFKI